MNSQLAKESLQLYRPGTKDELEAAFAGAVAQAKRDPELGQWFEQQQAFHATMQEKLHEITPPAVLKERILADCRPAQVMVWWRRPEMLAIAAAVVILLNLVILPIRTNDNNLNAYRTRMVKTALRDYRMDILTNDLQQIRSYLAQHGAPSDYVLSQALGKLTGRGGALLQWHKQPVSLICFEQGGGRLLWLFVVSQTSLKETPVAGQPKFQQMGKLSTVTWNQEDKTYLLAGIGNQRLLQKYF